MLFKLISVTLKANASLNILLFMSTIFKVAGNVWHVCRSCRFTCTVQVKKQPSQIYATKFKLATSPAISATCC
jgi:hypothetical protein